MALSGSARGVGVVPYSLARSPTDAASDHHGRPAPGRAGDRVTDLYVRADGDGVRGLGPALADGTLHIDVGATYSLERAAEALAHVLRGAGGASVVLEL